MNRLKLSQELVQKYFSYEEDQLYYKIGNNQNKIGSKVIGSKCNSYICVYVEGNIYYEHIIVWVLHNGAVPRNMGIKHIDGDCTNNKIANLKIATRSAIGHFKKKNRKISTSKYKGVSLTKSNTWHARIRINGRDLDLGCFKTEEKAAAAYDRAAIRGFGEFAMTNE